MEENEKAVFSQQTIQKDYLNYFLKHRLYVPMISIPFVITGIILYYNLFFISVPFFTIGISVLLLWTGWILAYRLKRTYSMLAVRLTGELINFCIIIIMFTSIISAANEYNALNSAILFAIMILLSTFGSGWMLTTHPERDKKTLWYNYLAPYIGLTSIGFIMVGINWFVFEGMFVSDFLNVSYTGVIIALIGILSFLVWGLFLFMALFRDVQVVFTKRGMKKLSREVQAPNADTKTPSKKEKGSPVKFCPICGEDVEKYQNSCSNCGHAF